MTRLFEKLVDAVRSDSGLFWRVGAIAVALAFAMLMFAPSSQVRTVICAAAAVLAALGAGLAGYARWLHDVENAHALRRAHERADDPGVAHLEEPL